MGWRYLFYTLGALTLLVFFLRFVVFTFQESPKYLLYRGKDEEAVKVLDNVAKLNGRECGLTLEKLQALESEFNASNGSSILGGGTKQLQNTRRHKMNLETDRFMILFSNFQMTRLTILTWLTYICDYWGFTVAGT